MPDQNLPNQPIPPTFPSVSDSSDFPQPPVATPTPTASDTTPPSAGPQIPQPKEASEDAPSPSPIITSSIPPKSKGKIIATILGIFLLVGAVGAGVILVGQRQLFQQKAAGGFTCTEQHIGSRCEPPSPPNSTWSEASCVFANCPYGDTNGDGACSSSDTGVVIQYGNCFSDVPGWIAALPKVGNCYQYDTTVSFGDHTWCKISIPCTGWGHNMDTCTPLPPPTATPTPTPAPLKCGEVCPPGQIPDRCGGDPLICYQWSAYASVCRNKNCPTDEDCVCGGSPTPTPTKTATPAPTIPGCPTAPQCSTVKAYDTSWNPLSAAQLSALKAGNKVRFTISGTPASDIDKARFTINRVNTPEIIAKKPGTDEYFYEYTIPTGVVDFTIGAQLHSKSLGIWF